MLCKHNRRIDWRGSGRMDWKVSRKVICRIIPRLELSNATNGEIKKKKESVLPTVLLDVDLSLINVLFHREISA